MAQGIYISDYLHIMAQNRSPHGPYKNYHCPNNHHHHRSYIVILLLREKPLKYLYQNPTYQNYITNEQNFYIDTQVEFMSQKSPQC